MRRVDLKPESDTQVECPVSERVNAHDHHSEVEHKGSRSSAGADPQVGKLPVVPDHLKATTASTGHSAHFYKHRVGQFMDDLLSVKNNAIISFNQALTRSAPPVQNSFLSQALQFVIGSFGGDLVDVLKLGPAAAKIVKAALPKLSDAIGNGLNKSEGGPTAVDTSTFVTAYAHAVKIQLSIVSHDMKTAISDPATGKDMTEALGGQVAGDKLLLTQTQTTSVTQQSHIEALDAWTITMQKRGDAQTNAKDHKGQSYGSAGLGQLHLDSLKILPDGSVQSDPGHQARMKGVGNDAAQLDATRNLEDIPVQRTANVRWERAGGLQGAFGMSVSASGHAAEDGLDQLDRQAVAAFYDRTIVVNPQDHDQLVNQQPLVNQNFPKGVQKIWDAIKGKTPQDLHFKMKGD